MIPYLQFGPANALRCSDTQGIRRLPMENFLGDDLKFHLVAADRFDSRNGTDEHISVPIRLHTAIPKDPREASARTGDGFPVYLTQLDHLRHGRTKNAENCNQYLEGPADRI